LLTSSLNIITNGFTTRITLVSDDGNPEFGITCRRPARNVQRIINDTEELLMELEQVAGLPRATTFMGIER
jgi:hypothetical protein